MKGQRIYLSLGKRKFNKWDFQLLLVSSELGASLVAHMVKNLPTIQETQVRSLGREDHLEQEMATHSGVLTWRIPRTEEPGGLQSMGLQKSRIGLSD